MSLAQRRKMVDRENPSLSMTRQCVLLGVSQSGLYYRSRGTSEEDLALMQAMDRQYLETPFYGSRRMRVWLERQGMVVSRKRVQRLMRTMWLRAIYRGPGTSRPAPEHRVFPYLLRNVQITQPNQVWAADITYLPMARGFLYLVAIMDWHSRYVVSWRLSNIPRSGSGAGSGGRLLHRGLAGGAGSGLAEGVQHRPGQPVHQPGVHPDAAGPPGEDQHGREGTLPRHFFVERLWRTVKYEEVYLKAYASASEARRELGAYLRFYNNQRPHQALGYRTPAEVFHQVRNAPAEESKVTEDPPEQVLVSLGQAVLKDRYSSTASPSRNPNAGEVPRNRQRPAGRPPQNPRPNRSQPTGRRPRLEPRPSPGPRSHGSSRHQQRWKRGRRPAASTKVSGTRLQSAKPKIDAACRKVEKRPSPWASVWNAGIPPSPIKLDVRPAPRSTGSTKGSPR